MVALERLRYHVVDDDATAPDAAGTPATTFRGALPPELEEEAEERFSSDASAARFYLDALLERDARPVMRSVLAPERPENVPDLELVDQRDSRTTDTVLVRFRQRHEDVRVFGARTVVELTPDRDLVSVDGRFGDVRDVPPAPSIDPSEALAKVASLTETSLEIEALPPAELVFFQDDEHRWHLAWLLRQVPAAPFEAREHVGLGHPPGPSPRDVAVVNYLVDAHYRNMLFYYSAAPTAAEVPVLCKGIDEHGAIHEFWGRHEGQAFQLSDPRRRTKTFDLSFADISGVPSLPAAAITNASADWAETNRAAVSAHVNAQRVFDFYNGTLQHNGIDGNGMELVSVVNCTWAPTAGSREWPNAAWRNKKMWYGQATGSSGVLVSMSRHLDIIAHELTHGVIEFSSNLYYAKESGALNESFADIFGVMIANWYIAPTRSDVSTWSWQLGPGFRTNGNPLRDLSNPPLTGDPDHYDQRYQGPKDYGGVHTNSGIHNKAAFNLLTAVEPGGGRAFTVEEAAVLLYLCMVRLPPLATFADARTALEDVTKTYFSGDPTRRSEKLAAIVGAYTPVGIV